MFRLEERIVYDAAVAGAVVDGLSGADAGDSGTEVASPAEAERSSSADPKLHSADPTEALKAIELERSQPERVIEHAREYMVIEVDANAADEVIDSDGLWSLREAISESNSNDASDIIYLPSDITHLTMIGEGDIHLYADGDHTIQIRGAENGTSTIDASLLGNRIFTVHDGVTLNVTNVAFTGGTDYSSGGGAILNYGMTQLASCHFTYNSTSSSDGGGALANHGFLGVYSSTLSDNSVELGRGQFTDFGQMQRFGQFDQQEEKGNGGAIVNTGTLVVQGSTFVDNSAPGQGGAIANAGDAHIDHSTLSENSAQDGGAIANTEYRAKVWVDRSTLDHNAAADSGGGIYATGSLKVTHSTLSGNHADTGTGGAIYHGDGSNLTLIHNTVVYNQAADVGGIDVDDVADSDQDNQGNLIAFNWHADVDPEFDSNGYNLLSDHSLNQPHLTDLTGTNPMIGELADNGGDSRTHALLHSSPAIDSAPDALNWKAGGADQRGWGRDASPDRGAFEVIGWRGEAAPPQVQDPTEIVVPTPEPSPTAATEPTPDPFVLESELELTPPRFGANTSQLTEYKSPTFVGWADLSLPTTSELVADFFKSISSKVFDLK